MNKAVFLDKDGTLIIDVPYNVDHTLVELVNDCVDGLKTLQQNGYLLILVTNQAGIAYGYFEENRLQAVKNKIVTLLANYGITLNGFYYCPHHPGGIIGQFTKNCSCRKPMPGMLLTAANEMDIDLMSSWMIGDILNDIEAGNRAGCRSILIDNGNETEWQTGAFRRPFAKVNSINEAANQIMSGFKYGRLEYL